MSQKKYLVTAAAGKTGARVVQKLLDRGLPVRAMVRRHDERSDRLAKAGAEIVFGDLLNHDDVIGALGGVTAAYLCYPVAPGLIQATAYFADAARRANVDVVVNMSQISARENAVSHAARDHWIAERVLDSSGVPTVHLRPTLFAEWTTFPWVRNTIKADGKITLPFGEGRNAPIAADDQARVIVAIMAAPRAHIGKIYPLYGPVEMSQQQQADEISKVLGRPVVYQPSSIDEYRSYLQAFNLPEFMIQHFCAIAVDYQEGIFAGEDNLIESITGQAPQTISEYVEAHRQAFSA